MTWVIIPAAVSALLGLVSGIKGLKSMRSQTHPQAEISWKQPPLSTWRYETPSMAAITIHSLGLIGLTLFVLYGVTRPQVFNFSSNIILSFLVFTAALFAVSFTTYASAVSLAYHFAQPWIKPASYGISSDGMLYGGSLIGWRSFFHYEPGPEEGQISLYSSYSPALRTWVLLPEREAYAGVLGLIQGNLLPAPPAVDSRSWWHSPFAMNLEMAMLVLGAFLPALWGANRSWVWFYAFIAFFVIHYAGIQLMTRFDGRGQAPAAKTLDREQSLAAPKDHPEKIDGEP